MILTLPYNTRKLMAEELQKAWSASARAAAAAARKGKKKGAASKPLFAGDDPDIVPGKKYLVNKNPGGRLADAKRRG